MSLRARLGFSLYDIVGGILFLFGMAVYISVSVTLTNQVDYRLTFEARTMLESMHWNDLDAIHFRRLISSRIFISRSGDKIVSCKAYSEIWLTSKPLDQIQA